MKRGKLQRNYHLYAQKDKKRYCIQETKKILLRGNNREQNRVLGNYKFDSRHKKILRKLQQLKLRKYLERGTKREKKTENKKVFLLKVYARCPISV